MLTQIEAEARSKVIEPEVQYQVYLHLPREGSEFLGAVEARFNVASLNSTFIDFGGESIDGMRVNGKEVSKPDIDRAFRDGKLGLEKGLLKEGPNEVLIRFTSKFSRDGNGVQCFRDTDGGFYAFVQTVPYYCNRVFPVFDQPDLKARRLLFINTSSRNTKISNTPLLSDLPVSSFHPKTEFEKTFVELFPNHFEGGELSLASFEQTPLLASYLFTFMIGDYVEIPDTTGGDVPMSLFVRGPLANLARKQTEKLFEFVKKGVKFYEGFFRAKYPFRKYDFVFCPEFSWNAMEYPGAIVFNDRNIFREEASIGQYTERGNTILHELSHMWFGNLVTMRWWNDLWLNESFADFFSYLCLKFIREELPFPVHDPMTSFCNNKARGYAEDQELTTHPIAGPVADTVQAETVFDGITYSKGAAVLKQLYRLLGHESISECLGRYFAKFSWKNATLEDFLWELQAGSPEIDLREWNRVWIQAAGLNCVQTSWTPCCPLAQLRQTAAMEEYPTLRPHAVSLALFNERAEVAEVVDCRLDPQSETQVTLPPGEFRAVLPNYNDWAFLKVDLDPISRRFLSENFEKLDGLHATLVLHSLYEAVRDVRLPAKEFVELSARKIFPRPGRSFEMQTLLNKLQVVFSFLPQEEALKSSSRFFRMMVERLKAEKDPDVANAMRGSLSKFAMAPESVREFGKAIVAKPVERQFSEEEVWRALFLLKGAKEADRGLVAEVEAKARSLPSSDVSRNFGLAIDALTEDAEEMNRILLALVDPKTTLSFVEMTFLVSGLTFFLKDREGLRGMRDRAVAELPKVGARANKSVFLVLSGLLLDTWGPVSALRDLREVLKSRAEMKDSSVMILRKAEGLFERYAKAQQENAKAWEVPKEEGN